MLVPILLILLLLALVGSLTISHLFWWFVLAIVLVFIARGQV